MAILKAVYMALVLLLWAAIEHSSAQVDGTCASEGDRSIRLVGGRSELEGRVELCWGPDSSDAPLWSAVCYHNDTSTTAQVVCSTLGYSKQGFNLEEDTDGSDGQVFKLNCTDNLLHCDIDPVENGCSIARIKCQPKVCQDWDVRLVGGGGGGGGGAMEGRVEVCKDEQWGALPTCDGRWGSTDARVVCRQLGYSRYNAMALNGSQFGDSFTMFQQYIDCEPHHATLAECTAKNCSNTTGVAGVSCEEKCALCSPQTTTEPATATSTSEEGASVEATAENALPCGDAVFKLSISIAFPLAVLFLAALLGCLLIRNTQQKRKIKQLQKALETSKAAPGKYPQHTVNNPVYGISSRGGSTHKTQYSLAGPDHYEIVDPVDVKAPY